MKYQALYTLIGYFYLELINYLEHYGMVRDKDENGVYEPITKMHSWNSPSSPVMYRLQRHSDHHCHGFRPYQILRRYEEAPFIGFDYFQSLFLAVNPPLWFYIMNPRVLALRTYQRNKATDILSSPKVSVTTEEVR